MPFSETYRRQVSLLVKAIPFVAEESMFALKGGTAINLFVRDLPRLSVDIDLTYLPRAGRADALADIDRGLSRIEKALRSGIRGSCVSAVRLQGEHDGERRVTKLFVSADGAQIKIEVTPVLRGCVFETRIMRVSPRVEDEFGFAEMRVVSFADLYAGKMVAALDRQHPRDLFDVRELMGAEGIGEDLRSAFVVYLLSHNRPMAELLAPARRDIAQEFRRGFAGMTKETVTLQSLLQARENLILAMVAGMPPDQRRFLLSFKRGEPEWALLAIAGIDELPAVRWRIQNLASLDSGRREALAARLEHVLRLA